MTHLNVEKMNPLFRFAIETYAEISGYTVEEVAMKSLAEADKEDKPVTDSLQMIAWMGAH